ncbi:MAG: putative nicotinate phosphoribosyltransferase [Pedosphaera sp.]|nr:putative nicotinate phosphoribosyltransferase [Pedosphaera sp.]
MNAATSALLADLYELTMLQGYFEEGMDQTAVFEFFVRKLPANRNFLLAVGLEQALAFLEHFHFTAQDLQWLEETKRFQRGFLSYLGKLRLHCDVDAMPEGTAFFANEPILRVTGPLPQAQIVETRLMNLLNFQTTIASKAVRCVLAAPGRKLADFGLRRTHGAEAGMLAARASYLAGFTGTSNVLAGRLYDIPLFGTMAHSYIQAHDKEEDAFRRFAYANPDNVVFLLDTYDTETAAEKVVSLARLLARDFIRIQAVRLDSGDLAVHARRVREILDRGGLHEVRIFASGGLDEYKLQELARGGVPIDGFGVGTHMSTSSDAPFLDCAYKLEEYAGRARFKLSEGKVTWPGIKQVYRAYDSNGKMTFDTLTIKGEAEVRNALIQPYMRAGKRLRPARRLEESRQFVATEVNSLPVALRRLEPVEPYPVKVSRSLETLARAVGGPRFDAQ